MYLIGAACMGVFGFIYFAMLNSLVPSLIFVSVMLSFAVHGMMYGPRQHSSPSALLRDCAIAVAHWVTISPQSRAAAPRIDRNGVAGCHWIRVRDCSVHSRLRYRQYYRNSADARLHQPRHLGRASMNKSSDGGARYGRRGLAAEPGPREV